MRQNPDIIPTFFKASINDVIIAKPFACKQVRQTQKSILPTQKHSYFKQWPKLKTKEDVKKIVISGGSGFIGKNLIAEIGNEYSISLVERRHFLCSPRDNEMQRIFQDAWAVVHLAAQTSVAASHENPVETINNNINNTVILAECCKLYETPNIIYANTYVYGNSPLQPIDEHQTVKLPSPYHISKYLSEQVLLNYCYKSNTNVTSLRIFNIYGRGQRPEFLISKIAKSAILRQTLHLNSLRPRRDFLEISDLVGLLKRIIAAKNISSGIYNVGFGKSYSVGEVVETVEAIIKVKIKINVSESERPNEILECVCDNRRVAATFCWKPLINLESGLRMILTELENEITK